MIEVKNVVKTFDGFAALNDATLSVPTGAVYGLVGPTARASPPSSATSPAFSGRTAAPCGWAARMCGKTRR